MTYKKDLLEALIQIATTEQPPIYRTGFTHGEMELLLVIDAMKEIAREALK